MPDYYIDPRAAAGGDGTMFSPWRTYASVPSLLPNDTVSWACGSVSTGQVLYNAGRGASTTLASPIRFNSFGSGPKPRILGSDGQYAFDVDSRNGVIIEDLQIGAIGSKTFGLRVLNSGQSTVQRNTFERQCDYGVRIDNTTSSALSTINVLQNEVQGTFSNAGILVIWGSGIGGVFEDVRILGNDIRDTGVLDNGPPTNGPYGIRCISRNGAVTASNGTVDLDLFVRGIEIVGNRVKNSRAGGLWLMAASTGGGSTLKNRIAENRLVDVGDGTYDSHVLWTGGCRDTSIEYNIIDGSIMAQGISSGTGVGIFVDNTGFNQYFDGCRRMVVRGNKVRNTGKNADGSLNQQLEIAGAGIFVYYSSDVQVVNNETDGCYNGMGVLGWFGTGSKSSNVQLRGNRVLNSVKNGVSTIAGADAVAVQENYVDGFGQDGIYVENSGAGAVTGYTETRNNVVGSAETAYRGGSQPTSQTTPSAQRIPAAGNIVLPAQWF